MAVLVRLDMTSEVPIYAQIADSIRSQIRSGGLATGARLPAARSLAQSLDVNIHTVLKAYSDLESHGLVKVRRGRGGVVVLGEVGLGEVIDLLIRRAKEVGTTRSQVVEMLREAW